MLFHEIYGSYYRVTAALLREAIDGRLTRRRMTELIQRQAFSESLMTIPDRLTGERWMLMREDFTTPVERVPDQPLTLLQRRWLKAVALDPRIQLFDPDMTGLEDVEPLFTPDMFVYYDRYGDGDDYADANYVARFRTILRALRESKNLYLRYQAPRGQELAIIVTPQQLEYSEKDDRFRLVAAGRRRSWIINLSRVTRCELALNNELHPGRAQTEASVTFELIDRRNALERVLLHFSHLKKETERLDGDRYRVTLWYDRSDETEMVIRLLSFGPAIRVIEPEHMKALLIERIQRQMELAEKRDCNP